MQDKGISVVVQHAQDFISRRLAAAVPINDGKQTPFRGHPVFVAQHATACCCRGCLAQWHEIPTGHALTMDEQSYVVGVLERWLHMQLANQE